MIKVLFLPEVVDQFLELAEVLYNKGYLGFKDIAIDYAEKLFRDIQANLHTKVKKNAPTHFDRYGQGIFYSLFPRNHHTTWYVFYSVHEVDDQTIYLVRYLGNNHTLGHKLSD